MVKKELYIYHPYATISAADLRISLDKLNLKQIFLRCSIDVEKPAKALQIFKFEVQWHFQI